MHYNPRKKNREILDWCLKRIQTVPYRVTARWLFYRLIQERDDMSKKDYKNFLQYTSRARKRFYNGWRPNTLTDDTRASYKRGFGYFTEDQWLSHFKKEEAVFDKYLNQEKIVEIWFEAEAMYSQFEHYSRPYCITLRPFKGDASIDYKWRISQDLDYLDTMYKKKIVILYFGDFDEKGFKIPEAAVKDIREWSHTPFSFIRCGINKDQIVAWGITEAFDKKGTYQWEALPENRAKALIVDNIEKHWSLQKVKEVEKNEEVATERWQQLIENAMSND